MADWRQEMINQLKSINDKLDKISEHNLKEPAKLYKCDKCDYVTDNRYKFAAHGNKHKGGG